MTDNQKENRYIFCMKWGTKYGADYVNKLYNMVSRNLNGDFQMVCFTDDYTGINPNVLCLPIPELNAPIAAGQRDGAWKKLTTFDAEFHKKHNLHGTALFLDLDVVITGSLDGFFSEKGDFLIIRDYLRFWRSKNRFIGNSSVYRFKLGEHFDALKYFRENTEYVRANHRNEQHFLSHFLQKQGKLNYWPKSWCPSFKYDCIPQFPANLFNEPILPKDARIIIFHGEVNPPDALIGKRNKKFGYIKPAKWVGEFWK